MPSHTPCQIVLQRPAVLNEANNLATFKGAKTILQPPFSLIVDQDSGSGLFRRIAFSRWVEETILREGYFVRNARTKRVRFNKRQIVVVEGNCPRDVAETCQNATTRAGKIAKFVLLQKP